MRDHKRTQHLVYYTRRAFVLTARPFPSFRDIILARTLSKFRISVNMYMFTHSLALSLSLTLSLSRYRRVDTDQSWTRTPRTTTSRTNRRRYLILCCNVKCNTKCLHFFLSLSKRALNAPGGVRPTSRRQKGATTVLQLSFASCCVSNDGRRSVIHRRDDVNAAKTTLVSGEKSASESSLGAVNVVFKTRAKGAASRATGRNGTLWKSSWTRAPSRAFARYV